MLYATFKTQDGHDALAMLRESVCASCAQLIERASAAVIVEPQLRSKEQRA